MRRNAYSSSCKVSVMFDGFWSKNEMAQQAVVHDPNIKCHEDSISAARAAICLQTDERNEGFLMKGLTNGKQLITAQLVNNFSTFYSLCVSWPCLKDSPPVDITSKRVLENDIHDVESCSAAYFWIKGCWIVAYSLDTVNCLVHLIM